MAPGNVKEGVNRHGDATEASVAPPPELEQLGDEGPLCIGDDFCVIAPLATPDGTSTPQGNKSP
ncbi:uncharacterized protein STAUR_0550 [Stigmatella aurantiaca DW4/3-1]|uniref:Uncharacterized protein n=1 Tax=Stigmatella aurantiaca (strain DW4/3-1) TaxID=378806 RepID=E3FTE0_STIAD|nr:uncharacterized protein STAUR_0550 [Stigmatella aurantiaca DW4/3-1]